MEQSSGMRLPRIAFTMGDPCGIGPEIAVRLIRDLNAEHVPAQLLVYGAPSVMAEAVRRFAPEARFTMVDCGDLPMESVTPGQLNPKAGLSAYHAVEQAARDALAGKIDAMVTCPMNKAAVNEAGIPFTGHTEFIAEICGCRSFAMMQSAGKLHVVFVTTHIPLREVADAVTADRIAEVTRLLAGVLNEEGVSCPRLAMCALNPHAGENGHMGGEDELVVKPVTARLRDEGFLLEGPFPPDTLFIPRTLERFDGVISMYHDQGHIPFKMLAFDCGVNSTLGIPVIRTSVDHGTAFEIAWQDKAGTGSLRAAFDSALRRARHRINTERM